MKKIIFSAIALLTLASCSKETNEVESFNDDVVRLSSGIVTRASDTEWSKGDAISVFAYNTGAYDDVIASNLQHNADAKGEISTFTPNKSGDYFFYPTDGTNIDVYAIYPFAISTTLLDYSIDVTTPKQSDHTKIDLMAATATNNTKSSSAINMTFDHKLAQIVVTLTAADNGGLTSDDLAASTTTVTLGGTQAVGSYNIATDDVSATGALTDIVLSTTKEESVISSTFMVIPQEAVTPTFTITINGVEYSVSANKFTIESGNIYTYALSVSKTAVKIKGATINKWGTNDKGFLDASDLEVVAAAVSGVTADDDCKNNQITVSWEYSNGTTNIGAVVIYYKAKDDAAYSSIVQTDITQTSASFGATSNTTYNIYVTTTTSTIAGAANETASDVTLENPLSLLYTTSD